MSEQYYDETNFWDTEACADSASSETEELKANVPRGSNQFYNKLKACKGKIKSKDYDEFVLSNPNIEVSL